jgi:hypothetical protein
MSVIAPIAIIVVPTMDVTTAGVKIAVTRFCRRARVRRGVVRPVELPDRVRAGGRCRVATG